MLTVSELLVVAGWICRFKVNYHSPKVLMLTRSEVCVNHIAYILATMFSVGSSISKAPPALASHLSTVVIDEIKDSSETEVMQGN